MRFVPFHHLLEISIGNTPAFYHGRSQLCGESTLSKQDCWVTFTWRKVRRRCYSDLMCSGKLWLQLAFPGHSNVYPFSRVKSSRTSQQYLYVLTFWFHILSLLVLHQKLSNSSAFAIEAKDNPPLRTSFKRAGFQIDKEKGWTEEPQP